MSENDKYKQFLPHDKLAASKRIFAEGPAKTPPPHQEKIPSGFDPMGEIYLRGRAFRGLAGGGPPWWVLITGWLLFGSAALMILTLAITTLAFELLPILIIVLIFILILWRGTVAKLSTKKRKGRR